MSAKFRYNGHFFDLPWIWADVLRPQDRFLWTEENKPGVMGILSDSVLQFRLREAYVANLYREMEAPEWPCLN